MNRDAPASDARAVVALQLDDAGQRRIAARLEANGLVPRFVSRTADLKAVLGDSAWLFCGRPPRLDWSAAKPLRLIQIAGAGVDPLFPAHGLHEGVFIANSRGIQADAVRDHAIALLLALARGLPELFASQARREWSPVPREPLSGKVLAVLGAGAVGGRVVSAAHGLGLRVRVLRRTQNALAGTDFVGTPPDLGAVLSGADYVIACLPLTSRTRDLLDAATLALLPAHASVIDVSRGGVIDHAALEAALRGGTLRSAALDVFADEPLPKTSTLWPCPGLVLTPHVGGLTPDYLDRALDVFVRNVALIQSGQRPTNAVSREHEY